MLRARHIPILIRAFGGWLVRTRAGRRLGAVVVLLTLVPSFCGGTRHGGWAGFSNQIAPSEGEILLEGTGSSMTCIVRGETGYASGDGWVFKGEATVSETSCEGNIQLSGRVSAVLKLERRWSGRIKGIGGDWEDTDGEATCEGNLTGTLRAGGTWEGKCKRDGKEYDASFAWKLD
jgi:hypothetical protein